MNVFLITKTVGRHDDGDATNVTGFISRTKAESFIEKKNAEFILMMETNNKLAAFHEQYSLEYRGPTIPSDKIKPRPKWPAGLSEQQITAEMREERANVDHDNELVMNEYYERCQRWNEAAFQAQLQFAATAGIPKPAAPVLYHVRESERPTYEIEELSVCDFPKPGFIGFDRFMELAAKAGHKNDMPFNKTITPDVQLKYVKFGLAFVEELAAKNGNINDILLERILEIAKQKADYHEVDWSVLEGEAMATAMLNNSMQELFFTRFAYCIHRELYVVPSLELDQQPEKEVNASSTSISNDNKNG